MLSVGDSFCCLRFILPQIPQISQILYIPVSVFICAICGKLLRPRYPCSSAISVGAILCILRLFSHRFHGFSQMHLEIVLPQIPQIFTDSIYSNIRVHPRYPWETPSHPISVFICAICGKLLRPRYPCSSAISVGAILCILRLFSHRFHGFSQMHLEIVLPQIPQIFTDFIYPRIRVHLCYLWEILSHPISVFICAICGRFPLLLGIYSPTDSTDIHRFYIFQYPCLSVLSVGDSFARRWKLLFFHRQRDAASALIHFRHSHHHVLVQLHHVVRVLHVAVSQL